MDANAELVIHPATSCEAVRRIAVAIGRSEAVLRMSWHIEGEIDRLRLPEASTPLRADGLWQHSCLEAFLRADDADSYFEFNLAPSGAWAVYRFGARRKDRDSPASAAPLVSTHRSAWAFDMNVVLRLESLPELARAATIDAGLAAVIEDGRGMLSYWALAHRAQEPDFHDPATFLCRMAAP